MPTPKSFAITIFDPHAHQMARPRTSPCRGRIEDAIEEFRKANELETAYYRTEHIPPGYDGILALQLEPSGYVL